MQEKELLLYLFGRKEHMSWKEGPHQESRQETPCDLSGPLPTKGRWGGSSAMASVGKEGLSIISDGSPCPGPPVSQGYRGAARRREGRDVGKDRRPWTHCAWMQE